MPVEQLTYAQIAERLGVSSEAARALAKRMRLPRSRANDGKTLVAVDLAEIQHKPLPSGRSPRGDQPVTDKVAGLQAKIATLEAELDAKRERSACERKSSAGHRSDYERERDRADRLVTAQDRLIAELEALRALLAAAQELARPVTSRTWREMSWRERVRWLRSTG